MMVFYQFNKTGKAFRKLVTAKAKLEGDILKLIKTLEERRN